MFFGKLLFSALLGGLVGIEREFNRKLKLNIPIGVRTMVFICVFGTLSVLLSELVNTSLIILIGLAGIIAFSALSYYARFKEHGEKGLTTYTSALIIYLTGLLVGFDEFLVSVIIAVMTATVLSARTELHNLARVISRKELRATILFAIIALVILPLLPNRTVDPFGIFNPFQFWLIVVLLSAFSFLSYILLRVVKEGLVISGFIGGFLNSAVTILGLIEKVKEKPVLRRQAFNGVLLSITASLASSLIVSLAITASLSIFIELLIPLLLSSLFILLLFFNHGVAVRDGRVDIKNPFTLLSAFKMAVLIFLFLQGVYLLREFISPSLIYPTVVVGAMISSLAMITSISSLYVAGELSPGLTVILVTLTSLVSVLNKVLFVKMAGDDLLYKKLWKPILLWGSLISAYFVFRHLLPMH